jgi:serine/threonine-protein kinase
MAAIHFGRQVGAAGFARTVAIKRLHPHLARDPEFVAMLVDEATIAARIRHPNVVPTIDVVQSDNELLLVMEYVPGESLAALVKAARRRGERFSCEILSRIMCDALNGLHAAHDAVSDGGAPLDIVHRDVSPSNVLVGVDGAARVLDFGVARASIRLSSTRQGGIKGKLRYMAPEQISDGPITRRTDVYAASVLLWELLVGEALFRASNEAALMARIVEGVVVPPSRRDGTLPPALDAVVLRGLAKDPDARFATARDMAQALAEAVPPATHETVAAWVAHIASDEIDKRAAELASIESGMPAQPALPAAEPSQPSHVTKTQPAVGATEVIDGPTQLAWREPPNAERSRAGLSVAAGALACVIAVVSGIWLSLPGAAAPLRPGLGHALSGLGTIDLPEGDDDTEEPTTPEPSPDDSVASPKTPPPAVPRKATAKANCDPPYTVDASGRRRVKRECL